MIRNILQKRSVRKTFGKVVDPETVQALLQEGAKRPVIKYGRVEFVLAFVRGDDPSQISAHMAKVADLAVAQGAVVHDLVGGLVIVAFGTLPANSAEPGSRSSLIHALLEQLPRDVKIVHGAADGHYGLFGSDTRLSYTFLVPEFDRALGTLSRLEFGESEEFTG
jgi:hypothetical protein